MLASPTGKEQYKQEAVKILMANDDLILGRVFGLCDTLIRLARFIRGILHYPTYPYSNPAPYAS